MNKSMNKNDSFILTANNIITPNHSTKHFINTTLPALESYYTLCSLFLYNM